MSPWLILIPVAGGVAYLLFATGEKVLEYYKTIPTVKVLTDGEERARLYLNRLDQAYLAYTAVEIWGGETALGVLKELRGTLDVVSGMAKNDFADNNITKNDLANIEAKISEIKTYIGGSYRIQG